ncbi:hypothetical protein DID96_22050 [Burkholderia sp. Bp8963]|uniref:hypothetical protein n=1 Tax=Burkholderia sp. Bp8963 TaxID=2184547 RepID=UPI000F593287|nr:hypothetical protein [Burkholderia sp. Bp8963]RQS67249.1 hypothetical protein DID96_22050 [Burkholderia sp. Bp8963]
MANIASYASDLDKSGPDRADMLTAVHRLNDKDPYLKGYHYFVVDLVKGHDAAFACVALADKDGKLERTDDQVGIMMFALEKRNAQSDCSVDGRNINTRADINAALKATGHNRLLSTDWLWIA